MTEPHDAIIEALHRFREDVGGAHDFDVDRIAATLRQHELQSGRAMASPPVTRSQRTTKARMKRAAKPRFAAVDGR